MIEYVIAKMKTVEGLEKEVGAHCQNGFAPLGNLIIDVDDKGNKWYLQPLIKSTAKS